VNYRSIEECIRISDAAFVAVLEFSDLEVLNRNEIEASARILTKEPVWGDVPFAEIPLMRRRFFSSGGGSGEGPRQWDYLGLSRIKEMNLIPIVLVSRGRGTHAEILHVQFAERNDQKLPINELVLVRELESENDSSQLRERLIAIVIDPQNSELLWSYALRKIYRIEGDPSRRFDLVLHPQIQKLSPSTEALREPFRSGRLEYATELLTGQITARPEDYYRQPSSEELRTIYEKLLEVFETAPSLYMADAALKTFTQQQARKAEFSDLEWNQIRARIRAALDNPEHPIRKLPAERQEALQANIQRVLKEPNPFAPEK
jgi:hypothetical protein